MRAGHAAAALALIAMVGCASKRTPLRARGLQPAQSTAAVLEGALEPRRHALLVGVDDYTDPAFPDLEHAVDDADSVAGVFQSARGGGFDTVETLRNPTRNGLLTALKQLASRVRRDDVVVVYFSGHGTRVPDGDRWRRFLLGSDSLPSDLEGTAVDLEVLTRWFSDLAPSRKALIVDACFNGDGKSSVRPEHRAVGPESTALVSTGALSAGEALLFATTPGRPSLEDDSLGHGVYTYYLLEAMGWGFSEADRDGDRVVTAWEAHDHARARTLEHTAGVQVPEAALRVVGMGDVVLAGEPSRREERERALVYLYADQAHPLTGVELRVDGRTRGVLPGTVPLEPGRHHLALAAPGGAVLAEGYATLSDGHAYRADDLARLVDGPRFGMTVRPVALFAPAQRQMIGLGAGGVEIGLYKRDDDPPGRNQVLAVHLGIANSPEREGLDVSRGLGWLTVEGGWQADWRRIRGRLTWTVTGVLVPPSYGEAGRPDGVPPSELPGQAGWMFGTTGPGLQVGWVLSEVWSAHVMARPTLTALDTDQDGTLDPAPWITAGVGFDGVF